LNKSILNNKTFVLQENSRNGKVNTTTTFHYKQENNLVTADYKGGTIIYGKIIALLDKDKLDMRYQCVTTDQELKSGKAIALISKTDDSKLQLSLDWQWLEGNKATGKSVYIEIG